jgi:hypothetical protein
LPPELDALAIDNKGGLYVLTLGLKTHSGRLLEIEFRRR